MTIVEPDCPPAGAPRFVEYQPVAIAPGLMGSPS
jgi:hypothetical protein